MKSLAAITTLLALAGAPAALAQSQGQLETQRAPVERAAPEDTHGNGTAYSPAEKGVGEQQGAPSGDRLARPADPNYVPPPGPTDRMEPAAKRGDTSATTAKPEETLSEDRRRPDTAEGASDAQGTPPSYSVQPDKSTSIKRADDPSNLKPDPRK